MTCPASSPASGCPEEDGTLSVIYTTGAAWIVKDGGEDAIAATNIYRTFSMCWALFNHYLLQSFEIDSSIIIFIDEGIEAKRSNLLQGRKQPGDGQRMTLSIDLSGSDPERLTLLLVCSLLKERGVERDPEPIVNGVPCLVTDCF